jgi:hypothetical protein
MPRIIPTFAGGTKARRVAFVLLGGLGLLAVVPGLLAAWPSEGRPGSACLVKSQCQQGQSCLYAGRGPWWSVGRSCEIPCLADFDCPEETGCSGLMFPGPDVMICLPDWKVVGE